MPTAPIPAPRALVCALEERAARVALLLLDGPGFVEIDAEIGIGPRVQVQARRGEQ
jgi:hypothetical protein